MRKSFNGEWLKNENGQFVGVNLGADYCSEHEQGIAELKSIFGIEDNDSNLVMGIERRKVLIFTAEDLNILDSKNKKTGFTYLGVKQKFQKVESKKDISTEVKHYRGKKDVTMLSCAWSEDGFAIYSETKEGRQNLRELAAAFKSKDVSIWTGGGGPFKNAGLCIAIPSLVAEEDKRTMYSSDLDQHEIVLAAEEIESQVQLLKTIKGSQKSFYSLSPKWASSIQSTARGEIKTKYRLIYWLNPMDQKNNNYGYYTVEELLEWADNKGPIPIQKLEGAKL